MTLLHTDWLIEPPVFTVDSFKVLNDISVYGAGISTKKE